MRIGIGIVALIVVGPKDLPVLFRQVGKFVGRAKAMAREFSTDEGSAEKGGTMPPMNEPVSGF